MWSLDSYQAKVVPPQSSFADKVKQHLQYKVDVIFKKCYFARWMKFLLKLKHYQLFIMAWGPGIAINVFTLANPSLLLILSPLAMLLYALGNLGWIWAICTELHDHLPPSSPINLSKFKASMSLPLTFIVILLIGLTFRFNTVGEINLPFPSWIISLFLVMLGLASLSAVFYGVAMAAKTLKSIETGRNARFSKYRLEFLLMILSPIGYWALQPRINRIVKEEKREVHIAN